MPLADFVANARQSIFDALSHDAEPPIGDFNPESLKSARAKGSPHIGTTRYEPNRIVFEFIYPSMDAGSSVVTVSVAPPERIVYLPVPEWVIESIWQGEVTGSYHFEREAHAALERLRELTVPEKNAELFGAKARIGRDG